MAPRGSAREISLFEKKAGKGKFEKTKAKGKKQRKENKSRKTPKRKKRKAKQKEESLQKRKELWRPFGALFPSPCLLPSLSFFLPFPSAWRWPTSFLL
jgi:hypothetical protein